MLKKLWNGVAFTIRWTLNIFWIAVIYVLIFKISFVTTVGPSMYPTMWTGDFCISYKTQNVERGDIVNIQLPDGVRIVKRVVGLPGEKLFISKQSVALIGPNDRLKCVLAEEYVRFRSIEKNKVVQLGSDEIWVMGDNRRNSHDSRKMGPVKLSLVKGKILFILGRKAKVSMRSIPVIKENE
jgi:signal peptidase I